MAIYKKLLEIQERIDGVTKDARGNAGDYVSGNKILGIVRPMMNKLGLVLTMDVEGVTYTPFETQTKNGIKKDMFCDLRLVFTWVDTEDGEKLPVRWAGTGANGADKSIGSAYTYAERYFILKQFHVPTDKDDVDAIKTPEEEVNVQNAIAYVNEAPDAATMQGYLTYYQQNYPAIAKDKDFLLAYNNKMKQINGTGKKR